MARRGIALLRDGGTKPVIVVTGATGPDTDVTVPITVPGAGGTGPDTGPDGRERTVISVHHPEWPAGMGSSLAAGLGAVPVECTAAVLALADQPLVGPQAVRRLVAA